jgi:4-carboxymuconolactone decarboxylase
MAGTSTGWSRSPTNNIKTVCSSRPEEGVMVTSRQDLATVSPALARYERDVLLDGVWNRPGLSRRDRSVITLAALVARGQSGSLSFYADQALEHGVTPGEVSEIVTHLAFYAGWGNAAAAASSIEGVFAEHGIGPDRLPPASPRLLPIDQASEDRRASVVEQTVGPVSPSLVTDTGAVLFHDLWLRPGLVPRDRSMVTVAALIASGQFAQITFHLGKAMDNGLSSGEAAELLSHLAYYAGWPSAMSAVPVFKSVFESRKQ